MLHRTLMSAVAALLVASVAHAEIPDRTYTPDQLYQLISPNMSAVSHNQPSVFGEHLMLSGNGHHQLWDIGDPFAPEMISEFFSEHRDGEAESHAIAFAVGPSGTRYSATITGKGIDLWDLSDVTNPTFLGGIELEGIDYGDNTEAVWGIYWQGDYIYVGGTDTGVHVVDATDPKNPALVRRIPTSEFGGVSAGPLWAVGNLLVVTTPKNRAGIATLDISDPGNPKPLDFVLPEDDSYMGAFFGSHAYLMTPLRTYDVTSDPSNIELLGSAHVSEHAEYMSYGDGRMFMGLRRPRAGALELDISDPNNPREIAFLQGRADDPILVAFADDQFTVPVGNLLVLSDDEVGQGSTLVVRDTARDSVPPELVYVNPKDGATSQALTSRVGLSFSDQVAIGSLTPENIVLRPVGGEALDGTFGLNHTVVSFWPAEPLEANTTYELVLRQGGVTDHVGNGLPREYRSTFSTGDALVEIPCPMPALTPHALTNEVTLRAEAEDATFAWSFGDGAMETGTRVSHRYEQPGRYRVTLTVRKGEATRTCTGIQIVHRPLAALPSTTADSVVFDAARGRVFVVNPDAGTVSAVDVGETATRFEAPVGKDPRTLALGPEGNVWVTGYGDDTVHVIDGDDGASVAVIDLGHGAAPYGIAAAPAIGGMFVTLEGAGAVAGLDAKAYLESGRASVGSGPGRVLLRGLAIRGDGRRAYVTRFISHGASGEVFELEISEGLLTEGRRLSLAMDPGPDTGTSGRGLPNYLSRIVISPDGVTAAVPSKLDNIERGLARDGLPLNTINTVRTVVSFLELEQGAEVSEARIDLDDHNMAFAATYSPSGDLLFVASLGSNRIDVFDAYSGQLVSGFSTGDAPDGLALDDEGRLYVHSFLSRRLDVFDVSGLLSGTDGAVRRLEPVRLVAEEPFSDALLLGKQLFYNANSRQMSQDGYISCAGCHLEGGEDGQVWDFTNRGEGLRNSIDLRGRAGMAHGNVHWSGNFDEIQDFEHDIRQHFGGAGLMSDEAFTSDGRDDPLGGEKAGQSPALDALALYVASLAEYPRSPLREPDGAMSGLAEEGLAIYGRLECQGCHSGEHFTDSPSGARHDVGTLSDTSGQRLGGELDGIDTPTLRGIWATPPYFHDGSAATIEDTLRAPGHGDAQNLTELEMDALVRFLLELDGSPVTVPQPPVTSSGGGGGSCSSAGAPNALWLLSLLPWLRRGSRRRGPRSR